MYYIDTGIILSTLMSGTKEIITSVISAVNIPERVMNAMSKILSPSLNEAGEYIGDYFKEKRALRQIETMARIEEKARLKNIPLKALPEKFIYPSLHYISIEENEDLKTKWVNLLTNALGASNIDFYNSYSEILSKLNAHEVKVLEFINSKIELKPNNTFHTFFEKKEIQNNSPLSIDSLDIIFDNLARLNLIEYISEPLDGGPFKSINLLMSRPTKIRFTALGKGFIESVKD